MTQPGAPRLGPAPAGVADLVQYQPGAIVSRVLMKEAAGSVTLFAFDDGQGLSEHTAPCDALAHVLDGALDVTVAGLRHRLTAGEAILLPATVPHALHAERRAKMLLTMIRA